MKVFLSLFFLCLGCVLAQGQSLNQLEFHMKYRKGFTPDLLKDDSIKLNLSAYNLYFSKNALELDRVSIQLKNPFGSAAYPSCYSVLYKGNVVSLFPGGDFYCFHIKSMKRNLPLEKKLNTVENIKSIYIYENKIFALSKEFKKYGLNRINKTFDKEVFEVFNNGEWSKTTLALPVVKQKIFEDANFYIASENYGEWGGCTYFYNKEMDTVLDMSINSDFVFKDENKNYAFESHVYALPSKAYLLNEINPFLNQKIFDEDFKFDFEELQSLYPDGFSSGSLSISSFFEIQGKTIAFIDYNKTSFLAEYINGRFKIVHPLFNKQFFNHNSQTLVSESNTLVSHSYQGNGGEDKYFIFNDNKVILVEWIKE